MSRTVKLLLVSSVTPKPTGFGEITLYRHLVGEPRLTVEVVPSPGTSPATRLIRRTPLRSLAEGFGVLGRGRRWDERAAAVADAFDPEVILTIAAGDGCHAALRLAKQKRLPLVTIFHDWWPDIVPSWVRAGEEARFRELYRGSTIALCVSEGMRRCLGEHPGSCLFWPIPGKSPLPAPGETTPKPDGKKFKICYSGNLREYAPMLRDALLALKNHPSLRLEVRGMAPRWPKAFLEEMRAAGTYHEFAPREELERWLGSADAFLVTTAFEPAMRRMMETNFPSKLLDFARFGKPLIAWGPDYSSLIRWAQPAARALCVTQPDPNMLRLALEKLAVSPDDRKRLAREALSSMQHEFDPEVIQEQFVQAVQAAVCTQRSKPELQNSR